MTRFAKLTLAAAALSLTALAAMPASAADIVVSVKGKTPAQIKADLRAAASVICNEESYRTTLGTFTSCVDLVYEDAMSQLPVALPN